MTNLTINLDQVQQDPLVNFINQQLESALQQGASDIHFEPYQQQYRVRARYDGLLRQQAIVPNSLAKRLISRLKVMAKLDITETRLPQDGRIQVNKDQQTHSLRISTCNTSSGEKAVLRLFNQQLLTLSQVRPASPATF